MRDRIRVYTWIGGDRPADTAAQVKEKRALGCTAHQRLGGDFGIWDDLKDNILNIRVYLMNPNYA